MSNSWEANKEFYTSGRNEQQNEEIKAYVRELADDAMYNFKLGMLNLVNSGVDKGYWDDLMKELEEAAYKLGEQDRKARAKDVVNAIVKGFDSGEQANMPHTIPVPSASLPKPAKMPSFGPQTCSVCNEKNEFAEPNQPNGGYVCYGCR